MKRWLPITALFVFALCTGIASAQTYPNWTPNPNWTPRPHPSYSPGSHPSNYGYDNRRDRWEDRRDRERDRREDRRDRERDRWERDHHR